jgi:small conductance mechanosensitive channel
MTIDFQEAVDRLQRIIDDSIAAIPNLVVAILILSVFWLLGNILRRIILRSTRRAKRRNLGLVLGRITQWTAVTLGILIGAVIIFPNFSPAELIQLLGLGSVAVGFAFRDVLQNFLVGILLLLNEPFSIGDQVIVDDGNFEGTVESIDGRATTIRTYDGRRVVIPNSKLYTGSVMVNTAYERRRIDYDLAVSYDSDIAIAKRVVLEAIENAGADDILVSPPPQVFVAGLDDFAVTLRVRWWIKPTLYQTFIESRDLILSEIFIQVKETEGVSIPFPTRTVHVIGEQD